MGEDDEILKEFLTESRENLDQLDRDLVELEHDPSPAPRIAAIFRTIHTIKGTSGFLGFTKLEAITHAGEDMLSRLRNGDIALTQPRVSALLALTDAVREILANVVASAAEGDANYEALVETLNQLKSDTAAKPPAASPAKIAAPPVEAPPIAPSIAKPVIAEMPVEQAESAEPTIAASTDGDVRATAVSETSIRVDVGLLDRLMNLVGELVLARNQVLQYAARAEDAAFVAASQRLNLLTSELQEGVMKTRMQPIGNLWNKLPRVVRDLAITCGKEACLELDGKNTELDRTIIEAIKDPLTHMVRNAVDHGIEPPNVRIARGKPAAGRLSLRAFHEGGQVNIEISDDGAGLDARKIRDKAVQRGLVSAERAARMNDRELTSLVFVPGFSTADRVTNVSGRGVGLDVVKTNIEKIGGTVDIASELGRGTVIRIKIPLTLAIIPAIIVTSQRERYAIPQVNLLELVRLVGPQATTSIEHIHGAPVYRLRDKLLPLVYLDAVLGFEDPPPANDEDAMVTIVVLQADDRPFGLVVDGVTDTEEIVVKPLGKELKGVPVFAGATIMGDGGVALILDVLGIAQRVNVVSASRDRTLLEASPESGTRGEEKQALLLFCARNGSRMAMPLAMVARLEVLPRTMLERAGGHDVIQYRGEILPVIDLSRVLDGDYGRGQDEDEPLQIIVYAENGQRVGLIVERILDIVEESIVVHRVSSRAGLLGAAIIQGRVTDLLDATGVIRRVDPSLLDAASAA